MDNLDRVLRAHGSGLQHAIKLNVYVSLSFSTPLVGIWGIWEPLSPGSWRRAGPVPTPSSIRQS